MSDDKLKYPSAHDHSQLDAFRIKPELPLKTVLEAVRNAILYRGFEFIYVSEDSSCVYTMDDGRTGSCLFGVAFIDILGVKWPNTCYGTLPNIWSHLPFTVADLTPEIKAWLYSLQQLQDSRTDYGHIAVAFNVGVQILGLESKHQVYGMDLNPVRDLRFHADNERADLKQRIEVQRNNIEQLQEQLANFQAADQDREPSLDDI
jgi:hypothetical protein